MPGIKYNKKWRISLLLFIVITHGAKLQHKTNKTNCVVPKYPLNGRLLINDSKSPKLNDKVLSGTIVSVVCNSQYKLNGSAQITCNNGTWSSKFGDCFELCPPITTTSSTSVTCTSEEKTHDECTKATNGTVATFKCNTYYENPELNRSPFRVCRNGSWGQKIPSCRPICGIKNIVSSDGRKHYYPWNAAIFLYNEEYNKTNFHCGGTLIDEKVILTAARCVTDDNGKLIPVNLYTVATGKTSEVFEDANDTEAQYSAVENTYILGDYKGAVRKFALDIAVVITKTPFNMTERIQPVCVDWDDKFSKEFEYPKIKGYIPGPLKSTVFGEVKQVFEIEVSIVNETRCYNMLASEEDTRGNFQAFFTADKLCADYINEDKSPKCLANKAVGLVAKTPYSDKYYIVGVVSTMNAVIYNAPKCDNQRWVLFTQVSRFLKFIREKGRIGTTANTAVYHTSCGTKSVQAQTLIIDGKNVTKGDYPWQVAVYNIIENKTELICSGTLINQRVILTAAHCISGLEGNLLSKELFMVAVGKYYRNFNDSRDKVAQFSTLEHIFVPQEYEGYLQNYLADIAILVTKNSFILSRDVEPVCVDWNGLYESQFLRPSVLGYVTGWGSTKEDGNPSEVLKELETPYVETSECRKKLPSDYEIFLTNDKMCAGYLNKSSSVCIGDSGGGLVFKNFNDGKYYLTGVVSLSPTGSTGGCDSQQYSLYTRVSKYINNFILKKVRVYWA